VLSGARLIFSHFAFGEVATKSLKQISSNGGSIEVLAPNVGTVLQLATDGTFAYWIGDDGIGSGKKIFRVPVAGGSVTTIASGITVTASSRYSCFATDGLALYFTSQISPTQYAMRKVPVGGGAVTDLALVSQNFSDGCVVDNGFLYFMSGQTARRVPTSGGSSILVASGVSGIVGGHELLVVGATLYVKDPQGIRSVPISGGAATVRASGLSAAQDFVSDGSYFFLNDINTDQMFRFRISDFVRTTMLMLPTQDPNGLALDATSVYWICGNKVCKAAK
jgi:hypothetical protein